MARVDTAERFAAAAGAEELAVRTRSGAVAAGAGEQQGAARLDQPGESRGVVPTA
jgi:hypothetical protein